MLVKFGVDFSVLRNEYLGEKFVRFHFDSKRKKMGTILQNIPESPSQHRLHVKGASEIVLECCSRILTKDGIEDIAMCKEEIKLTIDKFATEALRTIALAYKDLQEDEGSINLRDGF
jgi:magnesium-transporting ATPase (P-type)